MTAPERNRLAKQPGAARAAQLANRERVAAERKRAADAHSRNTLAAPVTAPAGFRGTRGRRPGSDKGQGAWRTSPYYSTHATRDSRWSLVASDMPGLR